MRIIDTTIINKEALETRMAKSGRTYEDLNRMFKFNLELLVKIGARVSVDVALALVSVTATNSSVLNTISDITLNTKDTLSYEVMHYIFQLEKDVGVPYPESLKGSMEIAAEFIGSPDYEVTKNKKI